MSNAKLKKALRMTIRWSAGEKIEWPIGENPYKPFCPGDRDIETLHKTCKKCREEFSIYFKRSKEYIADQVKYCKEHNIRYQKLIREGKETIYYYEQATNQYLYWKILGLSCFQFKRILCLIGIMTTK